MDPERDRSDAGRVARRETLPAERGQEPRRDELTEAERERVRRLAAKIDLADGNSILGFGVEAQREVTDVADKMLSGVRNKDVGPVGNTLSELMLRVRGLGLADLNPSAQPNWFARAILRQAHPLARFVQRYQTVQQQVDALTSELERHKVRLLRDVTMLDKLFDASLAYFRELELHIAAAEDRLGELDGDVLPRLRRKAEESGDLLDTQALRDATARRDDLERRLHDLRLTRQVTLQSLPQIRLIQDVDKSLISKVQGSILTTIPIWKGQIALAITLWNQKQALRAQRAVTETTNEMLARNAELLRMSNAEARREIERGVFDVETLRKTNEELIATIRESIQIVEEGAQKRAAAKAEIEHLEDDLRQALFDARDRRGRLPPSP